MFTKLLNKLGILTNAQKVEQARIAEQMRRRVRSARFARQAEAVITTDALPGKRPQPLPKPIKPSGAARRGADTDWQIVGYTYDSSPFSYGSDSSSGSSCSDSSSGSSSSDSSSSFSCD